MRKRERALPIAVTVAALVCLVAGCSDARGPAQGRDSIAATACTGCHGGVDNATGAPPRALRGGADTASPAVGAHTAHAGAGPLARAFTCADCHPDPRAGSRSHLDGTVDVAFGSLASAGGTLSPAYDRGGARGCSATYCHGAFRGGNAANVPIWTRVDGTQASCGTCHGLPPPAPHPQQTECGRCHAGYTASTVDLTTHVDGVVQVSDLTCTSCHGDPARRPTPAEPLAAAAPPSGTRGETLPSQRAVGAHERHVVPGALSAGLRCSECHRVPTSTAHADGEVELSWGPLATAGGASPAWNGASCASSYCHGSFRGGNAGYAPDWTHPAANACGTCHGVPPSAPHPQNPSCGNCHPGYGATAVNLALHLDGAVEVGELTCTSCHGDPSRGATAVNPQLAAAPPYGAAGETLTTDRAVGAHQVHLGGGLLGREIACTECHRVPTSTSHSDGTVELAWGTLATTGGTAPSWNGATCAATYCHGSFRGGNAAYAPRWTSPVGNTCGTCHGIPPPLPHPQRSECGNCHPGLSGPTHLNGVVDVQGITCTSCHGDASRVGTSGADPNVTVAPPQTATGRAPGAHLAHANRGALTVPVGCAECHQGTFDFSAVLDYPPPAQHPTGQLVVAFGGRALGPGADASGVTWSRTGPAPSYDEGALTCGTAYCHGSYAGTYSYEVYDEASASYSTRTAAFAGNGASPSWTGAPMTCASCHGNPPPTGTWHTGHAYPECQWCHPDATGIGSTGTGITAPAQHVNGAIELAPQWSSRCFGCH